MNDFYLKQCQGLKVTRRQILNKFPSSARLPGLHCLRKNRAELLGCARVKCHTTAASVFPSYDNPPNGRTRLPFVNSKMV